MTEAASPPKVDWAHIRAHKHSLAAPPEWPPNVRAISLEGLSLLGIHQDTGRLYWDGHEIITRTKIRLGPVELWIAIIATSATVGSLILEVGRSAGWWS
jgi:hypothetical protein